MSQPDMLGLPQEVLCNCLRRLPFRDKLQLESTCKALRQSLRGGATWGHVQVRYQFGRYPPPDEDEEEEEAHPLIEAWPSETVINMAARYPQDTHVLCYHARAMLHWLVQHSDAMTELTFNCINRHQLFSTHVPLVLGLLSTRQQPRGAGGQAAVLGLSTSEPYHVVLLPAGRLCWGYPQTQTRTAFPTPQP